MKDCNRSPFRGSGFRVQRSEIGGRRSEIGDQSMAQSAKGIALRAEIRGRRSEIGGQRSEVGDQSMTQSAKGMTLVKFLGQFF